MRSPVMPTSARTGGLPGAVDDHSAAQHEIASRQGRCAAEMSFVIGNGKFRAGMEARVQGLQRLVDGVGNRAIAAPRALRPRPASCSGLRPLR